MKTTTRDTDKTSQEIKQNEKSNITLSLDKEILEEIKHTAQVQGLSTNAKINSMLADSIACNKLFGNKKPMIMAPPLFKFLLESLDGKTFAKSWTVVWSEINPTIFYRNNIPMTLENMVEFAFKGIGLRAGVYDSCTSHTDNEGYLNIVIEHTYGLKWSQIISRAFSGIIENTFHKRVTCEAMNNTVLLKVQNNGTIT